MMSMYSFVGKEKFEAPKLYGEKESSIEVIWKEIVKNEGSQEGY